jgi:hypothetical protein
MLLEVLESVTFLETFPFVDWHYAELANVLSPTIFIVSCRSTALPNKDASSLHAHASHFSPGHVFAYQPKVA